MYFPAVMASRKIKTRTITKSTTAIGTTVVYQGEFNNERLLSSIVHEIISSALTGREVQEIKVTMNG